MNGERTRVSVIIPAYNAAGHLAGAVESALAQTLSDLEVVIVDDGSTDGTAAAAERFHDDPRVRFCQRPHRGIAAARNAGIARSRGPFIAFLDADDRWPAADKLELQVGFLEARPEVGWVFSDMRHVGPEGTRRPAYLRERGYYRTPSRVPQVVPVATRDLCREDFGLPTSSIVVRRRCLDDVGLFDEELHMYEDLDLWLRLLKHPLAFVPAVLVDKHLHGASAGSLRFRHLGDLEHVCRKHELEKEARFFSRQAQRSFYAWGRYHFRAGEYGAARDKLLASLRYPRHPGRTVKAGLWLAVAAAGAMLGGSDG